MTLLDFNFMRSSYQKWDQKGTTIFFTIPLLSFKYETSLETVSRMGTIVCTQELYLPLRTLFKVQNIRQIQALKQTTIKLGHTILCRQQALNFEATFPFLVNGM